MQFSATAIVALGALLLTSKVVSTEGRLRKTEIQRHLLQIKSYGGNPNKKYPLGLCKGDCDKDEHCGEGLICFQREKKEAIPGCEGGLSDNSRTDYCIPAPSSAPTPPGDKEETPSTSNSPSRSPTSAVSAKPSTSPSTTWPTQEPSMYNQPTNQQDAGRPLWPLRFFGANPKDDKLPLGPCYGNCRSDDDCDDGLYCYPRVPYGPSPGCIDPELDGSSNQFCAYLDEDPPPATPPTPDSFRLQLYWQEGYDWQEESFEREFCMKCKNGCFEGHSIYVSECSSYSSYFDFVEVADSYEILIKVVSGEDLCFERAERTVSLATCDGTLQTQRWFARDGGFDGDKFEISQVGFENHCMTQAHHPKHGELIKMDRCGNAIRDTTEFWNKC